MPLTGSMPSRPHSASVVPLFARREGDAGGERFTTSFAPVADLRRGVSCGFTIVLGARGGTADERASWTSPALEAEAIAEVVGRLPEPPPNCFVMVPVSPLALLRDEAQEALAAFPRKDALVVELTEGAGAVPGDRLREVLRPLRDAGASLAVSDADTGHGCLRQLLDLRPEFVSVGPSLVGDLDRDEATAAVVEMIGALCRRLNAFLMAEGVTRREELDALIRLRVPLAEGPACGPARDRMRGIDPDAARHIARRAAAQEEGAGVAALLERRPTLTLGAPPDALAEAFLADPRFDYVVLLDQERRPVELAERAAFLVRRAHLSEPLVVSASDQARDVAWRAMTRPKDRRFHPVACCDVQGRFIGIVRIERLFDVLGG